MAVNSKLRCKICRLPEPLRDAINDQLMGGASHASVVTGLEDHCVTISKSSVGRHAKDHLGVIPETLKRPDADNVSDAVADAPPPEPVVFESVDQFRDLAKSTNLLESAVTERRVSQLILERIVQNQLSIVSTMQREFMRGEGEYPRDPITGLKGLMDLITKLPAYTEFTIHATNRKVDEDARLLDRTSRYLEAVQGFHKVHGEYQIGIYFETQDQVPHYPWGLDPAYVIGALEKQTGRAGECQVLELRLVSDEVMFQEGDDVRQVLPDIVSQYPGEPGEQYAFAREVSAEEDEDHDTGQTLPLDLPEPVPA